MTTSEINEIEQAIQLTSFDAMMDEQEAQLEQEEDDHMFWVNRGLDEDYTPSFL